MGEKYEHASHYNCCCGRGINVHHPPSAPFVITTPRGANKRTHQEESISAGVLPPVEEQPLGLGTWYIGVHF